MSTMDGWQDELLKQAALKEMEDLQQHRMWWEKKNNGISKTWVMQVNFFIFPWKVQS